MKTLTEQLPDLTKLMKPKEERGKKLVDYLNHECVEPVDFGVRREVSGISFANHGDLTSSTAG